MDHNPVGRFSSRVADYVRYRPSYPAALIEWLTKECGLTQESAVADLGSGPGVLAKLLLEAGCEVYGVEPNAGMRSAGEELLRAYPRFHTVAGHAEATSLEPASVDLVTAAQAFHWFDPERTRQEFSRILRPPGWVALVWNQRLVTGDPFLAGYEELLRRFAPEYHEVDHRRIDAAAIERFFGHSEIRRASFPNAQILDLDGIRGRSRSASYTPPPGDPAYEPMMAELEKLFVATARDGRVTFAYETNVYAGTLTTA